MAGNAQPQFTAVGDIQSVLFGGTALTTSDGSSGTIGTSMQIAFTSSSTNGSYVEAIRILAVASTAATATAATVVRIYISSISTGSTSTSNTWLIAELALPAITADQTTTATNWYDVPLGFRLPASYTILVSSHIVNNANTNLRALVIGGDY
jgi:hypothetical protein